MNNGESSNGRTTDFGSVNQGSIPCSPAKWDQRFIDLAKHVSGWSKDPSTQVGAVIVDPRRKVVLSFGYNGFPIGVSDDNLHDREHKYARIVHAEINAIVFARGSVEGATLYVWPMPPCSRCAGPIIQAGISRVVSLTPEDRWKESCKIGEQMMREAGLEVIQMTP